MARWRRQKGEQGAALVSALLIVSLMAIAALAMLETVRFSVRVSINLSDREQARLYAIGAEELAGVSIQQMRQTGTGTFPLLDDWTRQPFTFPIESGLIRASVRDGANCFNLNGVVTLAEDGGLVSDPVNQRRFAALMTELGVPRGEAEALAAALADWIDSDDFSGFGGAEDDFYTSLEVAYRTPGELMADVSELRLVRGFTPQLVSALAPLVCVRRTTELSPLNLNTLERHHAPLLAAYLGSEQGSLLAAQLIEERPVGGFDTPEAFFSLPQFESQPVADEARGLYGLVSSSYELLVSVDYREARVEMTSVMVILDDGDVITQSRSFGSAS